MNSYDYKEYNVCQCSKLEELGLKEKCPKCWAELALEEYE